MTNALATMRVDYEQCQIKNLADSDNPMLKKRKLRNEEQMVWDLADQSKFQYNFVIKMTFEKH